MVGSRRDIWREVLNRFDPDRVTRPAWRAEREDSPAAKIVASLDRPASTPVKVLLSGTIGSGKSTELYRVAEARAMHGREFVIVLDLVRHFRRTVGDLEALQNVSSWEVCFLAGLALIRAAKEQLGYDFPPSHTAQLAQAWAELARASQPAGAPPPTIDVLAVAKSLTLMAFAAAAPVAAAAGATAAAGAVAAGGLRMLSGLAGAGKWSLPFGKKGTRAFEDQDELMRTLVDKVNLLLGTFQ